MKTRLLGAAVLIALLVIFVPMFFPGSPPPAAGGEQSVSLAIPPAQDGDLQTRTMSLTPGAPAPAGTAAPTPAGSAAAIAVPSDQLATVAIASRRPTDVGTDAAAPKAPAPGLVTGSGASPSQPVIPLQGQGTTATAPVAKPPVAKPPVAPAAAPTPTHAPAPAAAPTPAAASGHALYVLNLSAYANANSVDRLVRRVRALGYPVLTRMVTQAGKQLTLVTAGPFDSRTTAEAARLKITQSIPGVPARLVEGLGHAGAHVADEPAKASAGKSAAAAKPAAAPRGAGGYAVQLAALGSEADAKALRDKLRAGGFDGFVDTVNASGRKLWRVRAGPQTQHADAERVREQIKAKFGISGNVVSVP